MQPQRYFPPVFGLLSPVRSQYADPSIYYGPASSAVQMLDHLLDASSAFALDAYLASCGLILTKGRSSGLVVTSSCKIDIDKIDTVALKS